MTYVVTEACIKCKYMDCVVVCPVNCFYEGESMLAIHPDECIDCGVCEPECPAEAIKADTENDLTQWIEINRPYSESWPNITSKGQTFTGRRYIQGAGREVREILLSPTGEIVIRPISFQPGVL